MMDITDQKGMICGLKMGTGALFLAWFYAFY